MSRKRPKKKTGCQIVSKGTLQFEKFSIPGGCPGIIQTARRDSLFVRFNFYDESLSGFVDADQVDFARSNC